MDLFIEMPFYWLIVGLLGWCKYVFIQRLMACHSRMNKHHKTHDIQLKNVNEIHRTVHASLERINASNQSCVTIYNKWNNSDI